jgi:hypothetical protein
MWRRGWLQTVKRGSLERHNQAAAESSVSYLEDLRNL